MNKTWWQKFRKKQYFRQYCFAYLDSPRHAESQYADDTAICTLSYWEIARNRKDHRMVHQMESRRWLKPGLTEEDGWMDSAHQQYLHRRQRSPMEPTGQVPQSQHWRGTDLRPAYITHKTKGKSSPYQFILPHWETKSTWYPLSTLWFARIIVRQQPRNLRKIGSHSSENGLEG